MSDDASLSGPKRERRSLQVAGVPETLRQGVAAGKLKRSKRFERFMVLGSPFPRQSLLKRQRALHQRCA